MNAILFGYKRSGKTTLGQAVAQQLSLAFIDTDALLGGPSRELYKELGETRFRALEAERIQGLEGVRNAIIAVGGGAMTQSSNVRFLSRLGQLIFLKCAKAEIKARIFAGELPAFIDPQAPDASFDRHFVQRLAIYKRIPAWQCTVSGREQHLVVEELCRMIEEIHGT